MEKKEFCTNNNKRKIGIRRYTRIGKKKNIPSHQNSWRIRESSSDDAAEWGTAWDSEVESLKDNEIGALEN